MASGDVETRNAPTPAAGKVLSGYAALFNSVTVIAGEFREIIRPGAFAKSLASNDVLALLDHDYGRVIGRKSAGTLRIREDSRGLSVQIDPPDAPDGHTALTLVRRRDLRGMSFGFRVLRESWDDTGFLPLRTLEEIDLFEVSIVARPAYEDTTIALRSLDLHRSRAAEIARRRMAMEMKFRGIAV